MKRLLTLILALGLVIGLSGISFGAEGTFDINAEIMRPLTIKTTNNINFDTISDLSSDKTAQAQMTIGGAEGESYDITLPSSVSIDSKDGKSTLNVNLAVINKTTTINSSNQATFDVEATIPSSEGTASALEGTYGKTVTMTVTYAN